jgi:hypothetical protein
MMARRDLLARTARKACCATEFAAGREEEVSPTSPAIMASERRCASPAMPPAQAW